MLVPNRPYNKEGSLFPGVTVGTRTTADICVGRRKLLGCGTRAVFGSGLTDDCREAWNDGIAIPPNRSPPSDRKRGPTADVRPDLIEKSIPIYSTAARPRHGRVHRGSEAARLPSCDLRASAGCPSVSLPSGAPSHDRQSPVAAASPERRALRNG
jgi:hypothetical protein